MAILDLKDNREVDAVVRGIERMLPAFIGRLPDPILGLVARRLSEISVPTLYNIERDDAYLKAKELIGRIYVSYRRLDEDTYSRRVVIFDKLSPDQERVSQEVNRHYFDLPQVVRDGFSTGCLTSIIYNIYAGY